MGFEGSPAIVAASVLIGILVAQGVACGHLRALQNTVHRLESLPSNVTHSNSSNISLPVNASRSTNVSSSLTLRPDDQTQPPGDVPPAHMRRAFIHTSILLSLVAGAVGHDGYPAFGVARLTVVDFVINRRLLEVSGDGGLHAGGRTATMSASLPIGREPVPDTGATDDDEAWWMNPIPAFGNGDPMNLVLSQAFFLLGLCVVACIAAPIFARTSSMALEPHVGPAVRGITARRWLRAAARWEFAQLVLVCVGLWCNGPLPMMVAVHIGTRKSTWSTLDVTAALVGSAWVGVWVGLSFFISTRLCGAIRRARLVPPYEDDPVLKAASFAKRVLLLPRGRWSAESAWDSDQLAALSPVFQRLVPRRLPTVLVDALVSCIFAVATPFAHDGQDADFFSGWSVLVLMGAVCFILATIPYVNPWHHAVQVSILLLTAAAARVAGRSHQGASPQLSTADALVAAAAAGISIEAVAVTLQNLWGRWYRRRGRLAVAPVGFKPREQPLPMRRVRVLRRRTAGAETEHGCPPEDIPDFGAGDSDIELETSPRHIPQTYVVAGTEGVLLDDWFRRTGGGVPAPDRDEWSDGVDESPRHGLTAVAVDRAIHRRRTNPLRLRSRPGEAAALASKLLEQPLDDSTDTSTRSSSL